MAALCFSFSVIILYIAVYFISDISTFNIDSRYPIIIQKNTGNPNYFGASVSFLKSDERKSWVIIGSPKENSTLAAHGNITEPGVIWQCTLGHSQESCRQLIMSPTGNLYHDKENDAIDVKNGSWLGAPGGMALDSKNFLACASKWENRELYAEDGEDTFMHGICYQRPRQDLFSNSLPFPPASSRLIPLAKVDVAKSIQWRNGQAGFSIHLPKTGGNEIIMGAPGTERYSGSVIQYLSQDDGSTFQKRYLSKPNQYSDTITPFNYLGYSISSGYFFEMGTSTSSASSDINSVRIQYVAGAPRGNNLAGKVLLFRFPESQNEQLTILDEIRGDQTGSYFGASLLPLDINGDGFDDLLIAAPRYSRAQGLRGRSEALTMGARGGVDIGGGGSFDRFGGYGDEGAVFVYVSNGKTGLTKNNKIVNGGNRAWSQFGSAMTSLGDLNKDGYNDFAVSAPYENSLGLDDEATGAIYIYHGSESSQINTYAQVIRASEVDNKLRGFGISLGGNEDIDNNGFNDIVIGSFNSSQTVILRSKPVISVTGKITSTLNKLQLTTEAFYIESCVQYTGTNAPASIRLGVRLTSDVYIMPRRVQIAPAEADVPPTLAQLKNQLEYTVDVGENIETCKKIFAKVIQPLESSGAAVVFKQDVFIPGDGSTETKARRMDVAENGGVTVIGEPFSSFCKTCAVINTLKQIPQELQLPLAVMCGDDDKCVVELELKVSFRGLPEEGFLIGSSNSLIMDVEMLNLRETAIAPAVLISWSRLNLKRPPKDCVLHEETGSVLTYKCSLGKLLEESKSASVSLEYDMSNLVFSERLDTKLAFKVTATTASEMVKASSQTVLLPLIASADAYITGSLYLDIFNMETISPFVVFRHIFGVGLKGPTPVANIWAKFSIPVNLTTSIGAVINVRGVNVGGDGEMICQPTKGHFSKPDVDLSLMTSNTRDDFDYGDPDFDMAGIGGYLPKDRDVSKDSNSTLLEKDRLLIHCDSPYVACMEVTCKAAVLKAETEVRISFVIDIESDVIRDLLKSHKVSAIQVESKGVLVLPESVITIQPSPNEPDETVAITIIEKEGYKRISKWIYTLAIVIGLLVLACVVFCLYACGCFERRKPGEDAVDSPEEAVPLRDEKRNGDDVEMSRQISEDENAEPPDFVPQYPTIHEEDEDDDK